MKKKSNIKLFFKKNSRYNTYEIKLKKVFSCLLIIFFVVFFISGGNIYAKDGGGDTGDKNNKIINEIQKYKEMREILSEACSYDMHMPVCSKVFKTVDSTTKKNLTVGKIIDKYICSYYDSDIISELEEANIDPSLFIPDFLKSPDNDPKLIRLNISGEVIYQVPKKYCRKVKFIESDFEALNVLQKIRYYDTFQECADFCLRGVEGTYLCSKYNPRINDENASCIPMPIESCIVNFVNICMDRSTCERVCKWDFFVCDLAMGACKGTETDTGYTSLESCNADCVNSSPHTGGIQCDTTSGTCYYSTTMYTFKTWNECYMNCQQTEKKNNNSGDEASGKNEKDSGSGGDGIPGGFPSGGGSSGGGGYNSSGRGMMWILNIPKCAV